MVVHVCFMSQERSTEMGLILDYMGTTFDGKVKAYDSQKRFIDERELDTFGEFDDHKWVVQPKDKSQIYGEDSPSKTSQVESRLKRLIVAEIRVASSTFWMVRGTFIRSATSQSMV